MLKLKMMLCVMTLPLVVGCTSKQSVSQCVKPPPPPAWIMQPPPDWQTPLNGIISPSERLITMQKQLEGTQKYINEQCADRAAHTDYNSCNYCEQYTRAFQRSIMPKAIKTEQSIYECLLGFCFNNTFCAATNFGCIDSFLCPIPETKK